MEKIIKKEKVKAVENLRNKIKETSFFVFTNFEGLDTNSSTKLRDELYPNSKAEVIKNKLAKIAFNNEKHDVPADVFKNATMMFSTNEDPVQMGKAIVEFSKENEKLDLKGGTLDNKYVNREGLIALSKLPGKQELIGKAVMLVKSPINQLITNISSPLRGLIYALKAIEKQKQEDK